jgi:5'-3' exonuclease
MKPPVLLIDFSNFWWREYHANGDAPQMARQRVRESIDRAAGALSGALTFVCLDEGRSFRKELDPAYKAQRPEQDAVVLAEMHRTEGALRLAGYKVIGAEGFESDDVMATLATRASASGYEVVIATADKDLMQLLSLPGVRMLRTHGDPWKFFEAKDVVEKFGVEPEALGDLLALAGDTSDGIKGAAGVGPKTAATLLKAHGDLAGIYRKIDALFIGQKPDGTKFVETMTPAARAIATPAVVNALWRDRAQVELARKLVTLRTDAPVTLDDEDSAGGVANRAVSDDGGAAASQVHPVPTPVEISTASETKPKEGPMTKEESKAPANGTSRLGAVRKGKLRDPLKAFFYGVNGVGKSTLAAGAPDPIWADIEGGSSQLDVARYQFRDGDGGHIPTTYAEVTAMLDDLATHEHGFRSLIVDTADRLEAMLWAFICKRDGKDGIEDYGFGKGYIAALDEWRKLLTQFERLRSRGMNVVLIGHCQIRTFKSPDTADFDRYNPNLHDKASGLLKDWADVVGFCCFEDGATAAKKGERSRGFTTGRRLLKLERTAAYDAKSRYPMPAEVELDPTNPWGPFAAALSDGASLGAPELAALVWAEAERIGDPAVTAKLAPAVKEAIEKNEVDRLRRNLLTLKHMPSKQSETKAA